MNETESAALSLDTLVRAARPEHKKTRVPGAKCVHELFSEQAQRTPDSVALLFGKSECSYGELERRSNRLARHLQSAGVGPDTIVGLCLDRSIDMVVGLLAIWKAGGAYLPLDPQYPRDRLEFMLEDSRTSVVLTSLALVDRVPKNPATLICIDGDWTVAGSSVPDSGVMPANLAYVLYTSGSTGRPKGVLGTHQLVVKRLYWDVGESDERYAQKTTPNFIDALWELFMPLIRGQKVVILSSDVARDPQRLIEALAAGNATRIVLVPSLLRAILASGEDLGKRLPELQYWSCSGEALDADLSNDFKLRLPGARLMNIYGTSEFWDASAYEANAQESSGGVPIGRPIANTRMYVLDSELDPVPPGVTGELYIGGAGLARGYLHRPGLTAERFIADPFGTGERLYASGDLARYREDGNLEYVGRRDGQVKIRGFRIELGEVESVLQSHAGVSQAVVLAREDGPSGKRLVAYVVGNRALHTTELRDHLNGMLPQHMVPSAFVLLDELPLTPNGKIDRQRLPMPEGRPEIGAYAAPSGAAEESMATIWREVLRLDRVGRDDNFFELGGDSLLAARVAFRSGIPSHAVFEYKTIAALARLAGSAVRETVALSHGDLGDGVEATFPQRALLQGPNPIGLNMGNAMWVDGPLDEDALRRGLKGLLERQQALRSIFSIDGAEVRMRVGAGTPDVLRVVSLEGTEGDDSSGQRVGSLIDIELHRPFELNKGPLARALLIRLSNVRHVLVLTVHHAVSDLWSINIIKKELAEFYAAELDPALSKPGSLPITYYDFARWQHKLHDTDEYKRQIDFWKSEFADVAVDGEFPLQSDGADAAVFAAKYIELEFPPAIEKRLKEFAIQRGNTVYVVLVAALQLALADYSGLQQQVVWTPIARRPRTELEDSVGMYVNLMLIAGRVDRDMTLGEVLDLMARKVVKAYANCDVSAMIPLQMGLVAPPAIPIVGFNFIDLPNACDWRLAGTDVVPIDLKDSDGVCALEVELRVERGSINGTVIYNPSVFSADGVRRIMSNVCAAIDGMIVSSQLRVGDLFHAWREGARPRQTPYPGLNCSGDHPLLRIADLVRSWREGKEQAGDKFLGVRSFDEYPLEELPLHRLDVIFDWLKKAAPKN